MLVVFKKPIIIFKIIFRKQTNAIVQLKMFFYIKKEENGMMLNYVIN